MAQLTVKVGDTLSEQTIENVKTAIKSVDPRLMCIFGTMENGQTILAIVSRESVAQLPNLMELKAQAERTMHQLRELEVAKVREADSLETQARLQRMIAERQQQLAELKRQMAELANESGCDRK